MPFAPTQGLTYLDSTDGRKEKAEAHEAVAFPGEVDRIYLRAPEVIKVKRRAACFTHEDYLLSARARFA